MRKNLDSVQFNNFLIDIFKPIFLMADTKVLMSVIEVLSSAKSARKVKKEDFISFLSSVKKSWFDCFFELKSHNICFAAEDDMVDFFRLKKEENDDAADAL